jgi:hypothetical protein
MPDLNATDLDRENLAGLLRAERGLRHLRIRAHGALLILESGPRDDPYPHVRFRRVTRQWWRLEMSPGGRRWETVPVRAPLAEVFRLTVDDFGWMLEPVG